MKHSLKISTVALACFLSACSEKEEQEDPETLIPPDITITYIDPRGQEHEADIFAIEPAEMRDLIRETFNIPSNEKFDYRDNRFDEVTLPYIKERLKASNSEFAYKDIIQTLSKPEGVGQPRAYIDRKKEKITIEPSNKSQVTSQFRHASLAIYPPTELSAQDWVASWLNLDVNLIKTDPGIDDNIMEAFIRHHENGHAIGLNEPRADRYATLSVIKEFGVTDKVINTIQFIADIRLIRPVSKKYAACNEFITQELEHIRYLTENVFIDGHGDYDEWEIYHPIKSMNIDRFYFYDLERHLQSELFTQDIVDAAYNNGKINTDTHYLDLIETKAVKFLNSFTKDNYVMQQEYEKFLQALQRVQSTLTSDKKPSLYAIETPISGWYGMEFPGPPPMVKNEEYYKKLNEYIEKHNLEHHKSAEYIIFSNTRLTPITE